MFGEFGALLVEAEIGEGGVVEGVVVWGLLALEWRVNRGVTYERHLGMESVTSRLNIEIRALTV